MDTSMDLTKENEEYKLGLPRAPPAQKNRPLTTKQEEVKVTCHLYLPIRTSLFLGTSSGTLLMWKPKNEFHAEIVRTDLTGHRGSIFSILFLGDEASSGGGWGHAAGAASLAHLVATCSADRTVKIWDVFERDLKQRCIQTLIGHEGSVTSMTFLRGSLITCSTDNSVRIWRSSPERSLLLYPFFEIVQEIWGPGGNTVPASLAGILGQAPPGAPPPKEVLKSCPFVVGRLVRAEQQLLFVGDAQGRVYTFIPPARGGFGSGPPRQLLKENLHTSDSSLGASASTTPRRPPGASTSQTPRKNGTGEMFQQVEMHGRAASIGMSAMLGAPTSSTFEFSRSHKIHSLSVSKMLVVHAESLIITLSFDHTVQVHDATSARPPYFGMENPNRCRYLSMDWDSTNQELFLSDELGFVQVWNIYIEKCLKSVKLKDEPISSISLHNPSRGEGSDRSTSQNGGGGPVGSDANPQKLLLGTAEGIEVWTIQRNVKFNEFKGHDGPVIQMLQINSTSLGSSTALALPRASASQQQVEKQKGKGKDGKMKDQLSGEPSPIPLSALISEEKYLYSCSSDYTIRQWDSYDMNCLSIIKERQSEISCMAYLPGSIILATGHDDGMIRLWNVDSGTYMNLRFHRNTISALCVAKTPRQDCLVSASFDKTIAVWDVTRQRAFSPTPEYSLKISEEELLCLAYHQPLGLIFIGGNDHLIQMYQIDSRAREGTFRGHTNAVGCLALDGNFLISGSDDSTIRVWNIHLQYCVCVLTGHELAVRDLLVVPMYGFIVSTAFDGRVIVWDYLSGSALKQFHHLEKRFRCLLYDASQRKIFAGTEEARIMFFVVPEEIFPDYKGRKKQVRTLMSPPVSATVGVAAAQEKVDEESKTNDASAPKPSSASATKPGEATTKPSTATNAAAATSTLVDAFPLAPTSSDAPPEDSPTPSSSSAFSTASPALPIDYSSIVQELLQQSLGIQTLLSKVQVLPAPRTWDINITQAPRDDPSGGGGSSAANALKRKQLVSPTIGVPSNARRASLTNPMNTPLLKVNTTLSSTRPILPPELSPPTQNQMIALRRQSLTSAGGPKDLTLRPQAAVATTSTSKSDEPVPFVPVGIPGAFLSPKSARSSVETAKNLGATVASTATATGGETGKGTGGSTAAAAAEKSTVTTGASSSAAKDSASTSASPSRTAERSSAASLSTKRASMMTVSNLKDIASLLKPQPATASSDIDETLSARVRSAAAGSSEPSSERRDMLSPLASPVSEHADLVSPLASPLASPSDPSISASPLSPSLSPALSRKTSNSSRRASVALSSISAAVAGVLGSHTTGASSSSGLSPSLSRQASSSSTSSRRASVALSGLSSAIAGMLRERPAEATEGGGGRKTTIQSATVTEESNAKRSSLPLATVAASPVPALEMAAASLPDQATASTTTSGIVSATPAVAGAGDPNAPVPELKAARTNRFSMPKEKGRLEFNV